MKGLANVKEEEKGMNGGDFEWERDNKDIVLAVVDCYWKNYGSKELRRDHFSRSRLTKLVYLADWYYALENDECRPLTTIPWYFNTYGPYMDLTDILTSSYNIVSTGYGYSKKSTFERADENTKKYAQQEKDQLDQLAVNVCGRIIDVTRDMSFLAFLNYVYATPPVVGSRRYTELDLEFFAKEQKKKELSEND